MRVVIDASRDDDKSLAFKKVKISILIDFPNITIVLWLWKLRRKNITFRVYRRELIEENRWRAARYGLDGKLIDFGKSIELNTRQLIEELLDLVAEEIDELGTAAYLEPIQSILTNGTSADRQLRVYDETEGDLNAVVDHLIAETQIGL